MRARAATAASVLVAALGVALSPHHAHAQAMSLDAARAECHALFSAADLNSVQDLAVRRDAIITIKRCIDYGIDPPLISRPNYGRGSGTEVAGRARVTGRSCPPFASCFYGARVTSASMGTLNAIDSSRSFAGLSFTGVGAPPQFVNGDPNVEMPDHLEGGGTIYIYSGGCATSPSTSLVVRNPGINEYSSGGASCLGGGGHIMTPSIPPDGDVMAQDPVVLTADSLVNWDDWGIIVLPPGSYPAPYAAGTPIFIQHTQDMYLPAGTEMYTLPGGTNTSPEAEHSPPIQYPAYQGPIVLPDPRVEIPYSGGPPTSQWW